MVCGPGQCEWQEQATGRLQNWQLQDNPDPQLIEVGTLHSSTLQSSNFWGHDMIFAECIPQM